MGYFTWTFANLKLHKTYGGTEFSAKCKLPYDGYGCVLCPDGTIIEESCYEGYGIFAGKDVYELVVDWNKEHLLDILEKKNHGFGFYYEIAKIYMQNGHDAAQKYANKCVADGSAAKYLKNDWKRCLGVEIACENNPDIPFPIKIVSAPHPRLPYEKLPASINCQ